MKNLIYPVIIFSLLLASCTQNEKSAKGNNVDNWERLANLEFPEAYPTKEAADELYDEMLFQRASQSVIWSMPAMALWYMKKGSEAQFGEG
ncbi:MAG: hypothetical protein OQK57_03035, partial [Ignavibacteriaceae bacterium]|nr:hypothetical protein [Ignavibacteriaceae bacterium]